MKNSRARNQDSMPEPEQERASAKTRPLGARARAAIEALLFLADGDARLFLWLRKK